MYCVGYDTKGDALEQTEPLGKEVANACEDSADMTCVVDPCALSKVTSALSDTNGIAYAYLVFQGLVAVHEEYSGDEEPRRHGDDAEQRKLGCRGDASEERDHAIYRTLRANFSQLSANRT